MPTGYTAPVKDGKITEFKDFALRCARAFGALVTMRDDPMDAEIPDEIKPIDYHQEQIDAYLLALEELGKMTDEEVADACEKDHRKAVDWRDEYIRDKEADRSRYEAMLEKVRAWTPPTSEHEGLKEFMISQLLDSIKLDCSTNYLPAIPERLTPTQWLNARREELTKKLAYHEDNQSWEVAHCAQRTAWIRALKVSLNATNTQSQIEESEAR